MQPLIIEMRNPEIQRGSDLSKGTPACGTAQPGLKSRALPLRYVSLSSHGPWLKSASEKEVFISFSVLPALVSKQNH